MDTPSPSAILDRYQGRMAKALVLYRVMLCWISTPINISDGKRTCDTCTTALWVLLPRQGTLNMVSKPGNWRRNVSRGAWSGKDIEHRYSRPYTMSRRYNRRRHNRIGELPRVLRIPARRGSRGMRKSPACGTFGEMRISPTCTNGGSS